MYPILAIRRRCAGEIFSPWSEHTEHRAQAGAGDHFTVTADGGSYLQCPAHGASKRRHPAHPAPTTANWEYVTHSHDQCCHHFIIGGQGPGVNRSVTVSGGVCSIQTMRYSH